MKGWEVEVFSEIGSPLMEGQMTLLLKDFLVNEPLLLLWRQYLFFTFRAKTRNDLETICPPQTN